MRKREPCYLVLLCALCAFLAPMRTARAQEVPPAPKAALSAVPAENVPLASFSFEQENDLIVLSATLLQVGEGEKNRVPKETRPLRLLLDSGADFSLFAEEAFAERKIALPASGQEARSGPLGGIASAKTVSGRILSDVRYAVGGKVISDEAVLVPMGEFYEYDIDGIVGANLFHSCVVEVDYAHSTIRLFDPKTFSPPATGGGFIRVPLQRVTGTNRVTVPVEVTPFGFAKSTARLYVDTGSQGTAYFAAPFVKRNQWEAFAPRTVTAQSLGFAGASQSRRGRLKSMVFGGVLLPAPWVDFSLDTKGLLTDTKSDGLLGAAILSRFTLIFDFAHKALYLRPSAGASAPFPYRYFGLEIDDEPDPPVNGLPVYSFDPAGPVARAGIKEGEVITAVDTQSVAKMSRDQFVELLAKGKNAIVTFAVGDAKGEKLRQVRVSPDVL